MKTVFKIFASDIKKFFTSFSMIMIMGGILLVPPLYAWLNIYAFWDPYNLEYLKVAIVSDDIGATLSLNDLITSSSIKPGGSVSFEDIEFNIGDAIIDYAKNDKQVKWVFPNSSNEGYDMMDRGEVYTYINVEPLFSQSILDIMKSAFKDPDAKLKNPTLTAYTNEKQNQIAVEITTQILGELQAQISNNIASMLLSKIIKYSEEVPDSSSIKSEIKKYINILNIMFSSTDSQGMPIFSIVNLDSKAIYPIRNYGTGMAPFYTVLSIWVGAVFLTALLSKKPKNYLGEYSILQGYLGKWLLFVFFGMIQGCIVMIGDRLFFDLQCHNTPMLILMGGIFGICFSTIMYTLDANLGNIGKAIGIIIMLLNIPGSGGTFPIQTMPMLIQMISKVLPFTYAIKGMREIVGGPIWSFVGLDILAIFVFFAVFFILGLLLHNPIKKFMHKFEEEQEKSNILH